MKLTGFTDSEKEQGNQHVEAFICFANSYMFLIPPFITESGFISTFTFQIFSGQIYYCLECSLYVLYIHMHYILLYLGVKQESILPCFSWLETTKML